jgi:alanyl-tRNA synthetase
MTERLYYDDAYTVDFEALVVERLTFEGRPAVVLDRTCFYPTGGGQPCDLGTIGEAKVVEVVTRPEDDAVIHCLSAPIDQGKVACHVDWERRLDHMQQHTGQHILSQAFLHAASADTIGFHLGADESTIDLDVTSLLPAALERAEDLSNQIIYEDRPIHIQFLPPEELDPAALRRAPETAPAEGLRVVEIEGFDRVTCGGTHAARTGAVGIVKIIRLDKRGQNVRVVFRCGWRALRDYRLKNAMVNQLAAEFTVGAWELDQAVDRLREENKAIHSELKAARAEAMEYEAARLLQEAPVRDGVRIITAAFDDRDAKDLRSLVARLASKAGVAVLVGTAGEKAQLILARSEDVPVDMTDVLAQALETLGPGRGGGRPDFAQGGGVSADVSLVESALRQAEGVVLATLSEKT